MFDLPQFTPAHRTLLKVLRKSLVLRSDIVRDVDRKAVIEIKYQLSKCQHIYKLLVDYANDPTNTRWDKSSVSQRNFTLRDKQKSLYFNIWHRYVSDKTKYVSGSNITVSVDGYKILNETECELLFVVVHLATEMETALRDLERQQHESHLSTKLKGTY